MSERTQAQVAASRINGARSVGPVTGEGKSRSSQNATKHGIFSGKILTAGESQEDFDQLSESITSRWNPATDEEREAVRELVLLRWRIRRCSAVEVQLLSTDENLSDFENAARSFKQMDNVSKYQARLRRLETTGEQRLREIQEARSRAERHRRLDEKEQERLVAECRKQSKYFLLRHGIMKDSTETIETVEQILGVSKVPTDPNVLRQLHQQAYARYCSNASSGEAA